MKKPLLFIQASIVAGLLLLALPQAHATITLVQQATATSGTGDSSTATFSSATTAGNLLVVAIWYDTTVQPTPTISDNSSGGANTYTDVGEWHYSANGGYNGSQIFYAKNIKGGNTTVSVTRPSGSHPSFCVYEISGAITTAPLDVHSGADNESGAVSVTVTPEAGDFVVAVGTASSPASGFSSSFTNDYHVVGQNLGGGEGGACAHYVTSSGSSVSTSITSAGTINGSEAVIASFRPALSYTFTRAITIDHTKVPNTDQANFTVGIIGTYAGASGAPDLRTTGNGGSVQSASGYDIVFTSDAAGANYLNWEQAAWSASSGKVVYWVKVPNVSHTTDTVIYMRYGNSTANSFQGGTSASAWDSHYKAIWHMNDNTSSRTVVESIASASGTVAAANTSSKADTTSPLGYGLLFNGSGDYITTTYTGSLSNLSCEAWYKFTGTASSSTRLVDKNYANGFYMSSASVSPASKWGAGIEESSSPYGNFISLTDGSWHQLAVTRSSTNKVVRGDGGAASSSSTVASTITDGTSVSIGVDNGSSQSFKFTGAITEIRISDAARSTDWLDTEYHNINSPSSFYTISPAVSAALSTVAASPTSVTADGTTTSTITVTLKDVGGNPVSGKTVTLASSRGATDTISAASGSSSSSGVVTFTVKSTTTGSPVFTATDTTDSNLQITQTATVTFTASSSTALISSVNPALPGASVTFTATVTPVSPSTGTPTGNVTFKDGATTLSTGTLNGSGVATFSTSSLSHGNHAITAVYAGDTYFLTSTSSGLTETINTPPAAGRHFLGATLNTTLHVSASTLAGLDLDADGDTLTITDVSSTSANGPSGNVTLSGGNVNYTPANNFVGADKFTYTISDGFTGGTATSTANVTVRLGNATSVFNFVSGSSGTVNMRGYGIPTHQYDVQRSGDVSFSSFTTLATVTAAANGIILYTDNGAPSPSYYRFAVH